MSQELKSCCNAADHEAVGKLFDGTLLAKLEALLAKYGPELVGEMPAIMADIAAQNYLGAIVLIVDALAKQPAA